MRMNFSNLYMVDKKKLVSFIIPVFNSERFLKKCLDSVFNQTYENFEVIAIDDGSTDNSQKILQNYSDSITILSQNNSGLASSLQYATKNINGKWFRWFSPDDILYEESTKILVNNMMKFNERTIVYSNWDLIDENDSEIRSFTESNYNKLGIFDYNVRLLDGQQINVNTTLIPTSLLHDGCCFNQNIDPVAIDYDFLLRAGILFNTKFHLIERSLIKYRISKEQLSHKNISQSLSHLDLIRQTILSQIDKDTKNQYLIMLDKFQKIKPITKKTMELSLRIASKTLPNSIVDKFLVFYLNKIRRSR